MQELNDECRKDNIVHDNDVVQFNESELKGFMNGHHDEFIKFRYFCGAKENISNGTQCFSFSREMFLCNLITANGNVGKEGAGRTFKQVENMQTILNII